MTDLRQTLRSIPVLKDLEHEEIVALEQAMKVKRYEDGHVFINEGATANDLFIVVDGEVSVTSKERGGVGFKVDKTMGAGEMIGLIGLVDSNNKRSATCVAKGPVTAATLAWTGFTMLFNSHAKLAYGFQRLVASQLAKDARILNELLLNTLADLDAQ